MSKSVINECYIADKDLDTIAFKLLVFWFSPILVSVRFYGVRTTQNHNIDLRYPIN